MHALDKDPDPHFVATVLEAQTIPSGPDAFGQLKGGSIRVSGRLRIAYGKGVEYAALSQWQDREPIYETKPGHAEVGYVRYDIPCEVQRRSKILLSSVCVCILEKRTWGIPQVLHCSIAPNWGRGGCASAGRNPFLD